MLIICFLTTKSTSLCETTSFDILCVKIGSGASSVGRWKNPKRSRVNIFDAQFRAYGGKETSSGIVTKFCLWVDIQELITYATFGDDRLRGLGVARGRIPFLVFMTNLVALGQTVRTIARS